MPNSSVCFLRMHDIWLTRGLIPGIRGIHQTGEDGALIGAVVQEDLSNRHNSIFGITWVLGGLRQTCLETNDVNGNMCFIRKTYEKTYEVLPSYPEIFSSWRPTKHHFTFAPNYFTFPRPFPGLCWIYLRETSIVNAGEWMWNAKDGPNHDLGTRSDRSGSKRHLYIYHHLFQPQLSQHDTTCTSKQSHSWGILRPLLSLFCATWFTWFVQAWRPKWEEQEQ